MNWPLILRVFLVGPVAMTLMALSIDGVETGLKMAAVTSAAMVVFALVAGRKRR